MAYFMASLDTPEKNAEFAKSLDANFPLLSDPEGSAAKAYGVVGLLRPWARRWTFYIDSEGVVRYVDKDVSASDHGRTIAAKLAELGFPRR